MKKLLVIFHLSLITCYCAFAAQPEGAQLTLKESSHAFGEVDRKGGDLVYEFEYTNTGSVPLVILRTQTNCSCTKVIHSKKPLAPGKSDKIRVIYEPHKVDAGAFNKVIQIHSNAGRSLVTISGTTVEKRR